MQSHECERSLIVDTLSGSDCDKNCYSVWQMPVYLETCRVDTCRLYNAIYDLMKCMDAIIMFDMRSAYIYRPECCHSGVTGQTSCASLDCLPVLINL